MKIKSLMILVCVLCVCFSCTIGKNSSKNIKSPHKILMQDEGYYPKLSWASILERDTVLGRDSMFYFCSSHYSDVGYKRTKIRKICTCEFLYPEMIDIVLGNVRRGVIPSHQSILFYDSSFVSRPEIG